MRKFELLLLLVLIAFASCKKQSSFDEETDEESSIVEGYLDGAYCADVEYYNSNTGTRNTYTLNVEVEDNELTVIHWPNGGWLDESHFLPAELESDGSCSFTTDAGYKYEIQITGPECSFTDESRMSRDVEDDNEALICPECGDEKDEYDDYCSSCKNKKENTCSRCNAYEYNVNGGLCSSCKSDDEDKQREEEQEDDN